MILKFFDINGAYEEAQPPLPYFYWGHDFNPRLVLGQWVIYIDGGVCKKNI